MGRSRKVREFVEMNNGTFVEVFTPEQALSLHEFNKVEEIEEIPAKPMFRFTSETLAILDNFKSRK